MGTGKPEDSLQEEKRGHVHREKARGEERQGFWVPRALLTVSIPSCGMSQYSGQTLYLCQFELKLCCKPKFL